MKQKRIVILFPSKMESRFFNIPNITVRYTGVGLTASAYATVKTIRELHPDILILAGIAGVYTHSNLKIGDTVLVSAEHEADLGIFYEDGFKHMSDLQLDMSFKVNRFLNCPYIKPDMPLPAVKSNSMNAAIAPFVNTTDAEIENMEGSAFFYSCLQEKQPFLEVRAISNIVNTDHKAWDYEQSIRNMTDGIYKLIDYLNQ